MGRILYARFIIPKKDFRNSNQRLNPVLSGMKSARIQAIAEPVWREAVRVQFNGLEALEPDPSIMDADGDRPADDGDDPILDKMKMNLDGLVSARKSWDAENGGRLSSLKRHGGEEYEELYRRRRHICDEIASQRHAMTIRRRDRRKDADRESRRRDRERRKRLIRARLDLNRGRRVFGDPVAFHVMVHNISSHFFDSPNAWPTVKPIQDAATNTGIVWDDDNNDCIPVTTFRGGGRLGGDYVIDVVVEGMGDMRVSDPFADLADKFSALHIPL